jgi:hypothetical protein
MACTTIFPATQLAAMDRAQSYHRAMWVAQSPHPQASYGEWNKGNLSSFPNVPRPSASTTASPPPPATTVELGNTPPSAARDALIAGLKSQGYVSIKYAGSESWVGQPTRYTFEAAKADNTKARFSYTA